MKGARGITDLVGNTPLLKLTSLVPENAAEIMAKLEMFNPGGSVKDRIALHMITRAEEAGQLSPGGTIIEATSGNTGIGLAMVAAARGYKLILVMPDSMSYERHAILEGYGAKLVLTEGKLGMQGAVDAAEQLLAENGDYFMPRQFENPANPEAHKLTTAWEIIRQANGRIDAFVAGIGTGGTISGVGEVLKNTYPKIQIIGVEPEDSPVLSKGYSGPHKIQGIGAGFVPKTLNLDVVDRIITIQDVDAYLTCERLAYSEGILAGYSSGAALTAALQVSKELGPGKRIVTLFPDTGERYFSMAPYFKIDLKKRAREQLESPKT